MYLLERILINFNPFCLNYAAIVLYDSICLRQRIKYYSFIRNSYKWHKFFHAYQMKYEMLKLLIFKQFEIKYTHFVCIFYQNNYTELFIIDDTINKRMNSCEQVENVK